MRCELLVATCVALGLGACGSPEPPPRRPVVALPPPLIAPGPVDPKAHGAALLTALAGQLQPPWGQFLEDCRTRLPQGHALNRATLAATAELAIDRAGRIALVSLASSGSTDFDRVVKDIVADASALAPPDPELLSDDDAIHVRWLFARDRRQAGPATAELFVVELPVAQVAARLIARGDLPRAAARIARAPETDPARASATASLMVEVLRDVLVNARAAEARRVAVEAIGRARIEVLTPEVRRLLSPTIATELRLAAISAVAALGDRTAVAELARALPGDLASHPQLALAESAALVTLGAPAVAALAVQHALQRPTPSPAALGALAIVAIPALDGKLATWFGRGDARVRAAVCTAITRVAARPVALRGLRDPDATVRAACVDAIGRIGPTKAGAEMASRVRALTRDRDLSVRAHALVALAALQRGQVADAADDPSPEVRAAAALHAREAQLVTLAGDPDPDVRAAAITELGVRLTVPVAQTADPDRATRAAAMLAIGDKHLALIGRAASDKASRVRRAAVASVVDVALLEQLAVDDAPEVASDAQVALVQRRGRLAATTASLVRLAAGPSDRERVRIALAWLLATRP